MGARLALGGVVLPAAAIMAVTLAAAVWTRLQGILFTAEALLFFIAVMVLMPRAWANWTTSPKNHRKPLREPNAHERSRPESNKPDKGETAPAPPSAPPPEPSGQSDESHGAAYYSQGSGRTRA